MRKKFEILAYILSTPKIGEPKLILSLDIILSVAFPEIHVGWSQPKTQSDD